MMMVMIRIKITYNSYQTERQWSSISPTWICDDHPALILRKRNFLIILKMRKIENSMQQGRRRPWCEKYPCLRLKKSFPPGFPCISCISCIYRAAVFQTPLYLQFGSASHCTSSRYTPPTVFATLCSVSFTVLLLTKLRGDFRYKQHRQDSL